MTPSALFSSPFHASSCSESLQSLALGRLKKRRRSESDDVENESGDNRPTEDITKRGLGRFPASRSNSLGLSNLDYDEEEQYRTAGQPLGADLPGGELPHTALSPDFDTSRLLTRSQLKSELASLKSPIQLPHHTRHVHSSDQGFGLKQRHLAVLTAILHKSLLQDDYVRAGRAWGLLLNIEVDGRPMNIRANGLWGLGAEILLRTGAQRSGPDVDREPTDAYFEKETFSEAEAPEPRRLQYDLGAFENAKRYYQRLILQFPFRRWDPEPISSLHFYPALYGIWISSVQDHYRNRLGILAQERDNSADEDGGESSPNISEKIHDRREGLRKSVLVRAEEIAMSLENLLLSVPYSDDATLWDLKRNVGLWIRDLSVERIPVPSEDGSATSIGSKEDFIA